VAFLLIVTLVLGLFLFRQRASEISGIQPGLIQSLAVLPLTNLRATRRKITSPMG